MRLFTKPYRVDLIILVLSCLLAVFFTLENRHYLGDVSLSRLATVERLVEAGTWAHVSPTDSTPFRPSVDRVKIGNSLYSSKPPLYPLLMAAEAKLIKSLTGWHFYEHRKSYIRLLTLLNQVLPYCFMLLCCFTWLAQWQIPATLRWLMLAGMGLGLLPYGYAVAINNHTLSALLIFIGYYLVWQLWTSKVKSGGYFLLLGLIAGFVFAIELTAGLFSAMAMLFLLYADWKKWLLSVLGFAIPVALTMWVLYDISGSVIPFYMRSTLYHYAGSYWNNPQGIDALREPLHVYMFHTLLGHHGLFSLSPLLVFGVWGLGVGIKENSWHFRWGYVSIALGVLSMLLYVWLRTHNYSGVAIGLRWFLPFMPVLWWAALPFLQKYRTSKAAMTLVCVSIFFAATSVLEAMWREFAVSGWVEGLFH